MKIRGILGTATLLPTILITGQQIRNTIFQTGTHICTLPLFIFSGTGKMQKSVHILHPDRNKFSKMPDTKKKTKKYFTADRHFITTDKKVRAAANN